MKPKILILGSVFLGSILVVGMLAFLFRPAHITNLPLTKEGLIVMFGDSLVEGVGATPGHTLEDQLETLIGEKVLNLGVSGDTTHDALERLPEALETHPKIAIVLLGGNDFLQKVPREETFQNLEKIVVAFQQEGAVVVLLGVRSGIVGGGADDQYKDLAKKTGAFYMNDVLSGIFGDRRYMSDAVHPNDLGYQKIAERLAPILQDILH